MGNSSPIKCWRLVFWNSNHLEVASGPFCLLLHSPWPLVFALCLFNLFFLSLNLFCWKGFHFSWSNSLIFILIVAYLFFSLHFWIRDLIREFFKKYEILLICLFLLFLYFLLLKLCYFYPPDPFELTFANTLLLSNAAVCLGGAFVSLELSLEFFTFFSLFSFIHAWTFISLQIKEFQIMGLSINDSVYSCVFFFLTGLHFFHLFLGLFLLILFFMSCSFPFQIFFFVSLRSSEVVLF